MLILRLGPPSVSFYLPEKHVSFCDCPLYLPVRVHIQARVEVGAEHLQSGGRLEARPVGPAGGLFELR